MSNTDGTADELARLQAVTARYDEGGWLPAGTTLASLSSAPVAITVSDTDRMLTELRTLRGRTHNLVMDDRLSHTQVCAVSALTDALSAAISAALTVKAVTS